MALMKANVEAIETQPQAVEVEPQAVEVELPQHTSVANLPMNTTGVNQGALANLANQGYEGLEFDWTSFPIISLKTDGLFEDTEGRNYGKVFDCRIMQTKRRFVFRGVPVQDNKRDIAYTYDKVITSAGILLEDVVTRWKELGKTVEEKEYLECLVEMVAPGEVFDGELRILSVSPTSKGRASGHIVKAGLAGGGNPAAVVSRIKCGEKVTKVQNPFYPWAFEIARD